MVCKFGVNWGVLVLLLELGVSVVVLGSRFGRDVMGFEAAFRESDGSLVLASGVCWSL